MHRPTETRRKGRTRLIREAFGTTYTPKQGKSGPANRFGQATIAFKQPPTIIGSATIVGPKEGKGPLRGSFDEVLEDEVLGQASWEKAEMFIMEKTVRLAAAKAGLGWGEIQLLLAGDLLNQVVCCNFAARNLDMPFFGLYAACATWVEALALGAMAVDGGYADPVAVATCSHNKTAERQYRFPTELGNQRPPSAQWTVTGSGAVVLAAQGVGPRITHATMGRVMDAGIKDPFDMGSAMAPAAVDTIIRHLEDTGRQARDYDLILTGDLARIGHPIAAELLAQAGHAPGRRFQDCGILIFDEDQDVHAGGSGAACCASVFAGDVHRRLSGGDLRRVLLVATGALLSPTTYLQGESIPGIAHAVAVENAYPSSRD